MYYGMKSNLPTSSPLAKTSLNAEHLALFDGGMNESKQIITQRICRSIGLAVHRGWAEQLLDRCRDFVQDPPQPRTFTRETDEDSAKAHENFHFHETAAGAGTTAPARSRGPVG